MMRCPKCREQLVAEASGSAVFRCKGCAGVWLRRGELESFLRATASVRGIVLKTLGLAETPLASTDKICPDCSGVRLDAVRYRGIEVERCPQCRGVYADAGERETLAERLLEARAQWEPAYLEWQALETQRQATRRREREAASEAAAMIGMAAIASS